jgi:hypothetical protein
VHKWSAVTSWKVLGATLHFESVNGALNMTEVHLSPLVACSCVTGWRLLCSDRRPPTCAAASHRNTSGACSQRA